MKTLDMTDIFCRPIHGTETHLKTTRSVRPETNIQNHTKTFHGSKEVHLKWWPVSSRHFCQYQSVNPIRWPSMSLSSTCCLLVVEIFVETNMSVQYVHYTDVIMNPIASQITSLTIVCSTVYSDADQRKHQSSASLAFVWGIHRGPVNSTHRWPVTRKMFLFDDAIMNMSVQYVDHQCLCRPPCYTSHKYHDDVIKWKYFRVTGHLCGEFTGPRWIPRTKASDAEMFSLICARINDWVNNGEAGDLRRYLAHYDLIVMGLWGIAAPSLLVKAYEFVPSI